jgi:hypothetical protein
MHAPALPATQSMSDPEQFLSIEAAWLHVQCIRHLTCLTGGHDDKQNPTKHSSGHICPCHKLSLAVHLCQVEAALLHLCAVCVDNKQALASILECVLRILHMQCPQTVNMAVARTLLFSK